MTCTYRPPESSHRVFSDSPPLVRLASRSMVTRKTTRPGSPRIRSSVLFMDLLYHEIYYLDTEIVTGLIRSLCRVHRTSTGPLRYLHRTECREVIGDTRRGDLLGTTATTLDLIRSLCFQTLLCQYTRVCLITGEVDQTSRGLLDGTISRAFHVDSL